MSRSYSRQYFRSSPGAAAPGITTSSLASQKNQRMPPTIIVVRHPYFLPDPDVTVTGSLLA
jgi:hypothetical protein